MTFQNATAIVGVGSTALTRSSGRTVEALAVEACLRAIKDAGLSVNEIDGVVSYGWANEWETSVGPNDMIRALNLKACNFSSWGILGGSQACSYVLEAAMAVASGICSNVLVYRAQNGSSGRSSRRLLTANGSRQWTLPFGSVHAGVQYGMPVVAHMARYGTTNMDLAHIAIQQRQNAVLNAKAMMQTPITLEEHQASPYIVYPHRLLDCCQNTDGAMALVVSSRDRAGDLRQDPVCILAGTGGGMSGAERWQTHAERAAPQLYRQAGVTVADIDLAELYDPFTGMCLLHIEGFGLAPPGEGAAWVREGNSSLDGSLPVNTHGGLLSEGYLQGLNHVVEAVQQLRSTGVADDFCRGPHTFDRTSCRQVRGAKMALVCGEAGHSALLLHRES